jgi:hypothetical protein
MIPALIAAAARDLTRETIRTAACLADHVAVWWQRATGLPTCPGRHQCRYDDERDAYQNAQTTTQGEDG